jgi:VWFA-related protein
MVALKEMGACPNFDSHYARHLITRGDGKSLDPVLLTLSNRRPQFTSTSLRWPSNGTKVARMFRCLQWILILLLAVLPAAQGQNPPAAQPQNTPEQQPQNPAPKLQPRPTEPSKTAPAGADRQINLDVQVTDKSGALIRGLQQRDFTLLDDKQPQPILAFRVVDSAATPASDPPVEIVLVIDAVNASFDNVTFERDQIKHFLLRDNGQLAQPVSLVVFTDSGARIQDGSSRDGKALAAMYDQIETGLRTSTRAQGFYGASDRFSMSLKAMHELTDYEASRPGRKLVVWVSPGWPLLTGPNIELSERDARDLFNSIVAFSSQLRQARMTLYAVDPLGLADAGGTRITYYEEFLKGVSSAPKTQPANLSLQVLAVQSGGLVLNSTNDLTTSIARCAADAAYYYVVSFNAPRADHADEYHSLEMKVDRPKVVARTRTGYYAQP